MKKRGGKGGKNKKTSIDKCPHRYIERNDALFYKCFTTEIRAIERRMKEEMQMLGYEHAHIDLEPISVGDTQ